MLITRKKSKGGGVHKIQMLTRENLEVVLRICLALLYDFIVFCRFIIGFPSFVVACFCCHSCCCFLRCLLFAEEFRKHKSSNLPLLE